jgi:pimeloyl-ACP methyl ester carboxylesterase
MPDYADCLASFVDTLGLAPHVVGPAFGGTLALELYQRRPTLLRSLVLASSYAGWAGSLPPDDVAERLERVLRESKLPPEAARRTLLLIARRADVADLTLGGVPVYCSLTPVQSRWLARKGACAHDDCLARSHHGSRLGATH